MNIIHEPIQLGFDSPHLCECGCGKPTRLAIRTVGRLGWAKGRPKRFIHGHNPTPKRRNTILERFHSRVDMSGGPDACWEWQGCKRGHYGAVYYKGRHVGTHRMAWELANGPIPDGLIICHMCDNPPCCNPSHLFLGTQTDNARDKVAKGRHRGNAILPPEIVAEIWARYTTGNITQAALAREYGVHKRIIFYLVKKMRRR